MPAFLGEPFVAEYVGGDADRHVVDGFYLGQSIHGTARLYNSVASLYFHGPQATSGRNIRVVVGPPKPGSLLYLIYLAMVHGKMAIYPEIFFELGSLMIPAFIRAIVARSSGQDKMMEKALDVIAKQADQNTELARSILQSEQRDKDALFALVDKLTTQNGGALRDMVAPVGRSVKQITHSHPSEEDIVIDEPVADAIRSSEDAVVGGQQELTGRIVAVDTVTGACKFLEEGTERPARRKITDPALAVPGNIYTHALDTASRVTVDAKPLIKNGVVSKLYISDAKNAEDTVES